MSEVQLELPEIEPVTELTMEQIHILSMAPDFNENTETQTTVAEWKKRNLPQ